MPYLLFLAILLAATAIVLVGYKLLTPGPRGPITPMARLATMNHDAELEFLLAALRSAGIKYRVQRDTYNQAHVVPVPYGIEVWVREEDYDEARKAGGITS